MAKLTHKLTDEEIEAILKQPITTPCKPAYIKHKDVLKAAGKIAKASREQFQKWMEDERSEDS